MELNDVAAAGNWESLRRLVFRMEHIFDTVKAFSERTSLFLQLLQRFLGTLLDFDHDLDAELLFPAPFSSHYDEALKMRVKTGCLSVAPPSQAHLDQSHLSGTDSVSYTELLGGFQEHNRQLRELMVSGKSNAATLKRSLEPLFEVLAKVGNPKDIQIKNEQLKAKVGALKKQVGSMSQELSDLRLQKRLAEEAPKPLAWATLTSNRSDIKLNGCCEHLRAVVDQKNGVIADLTERLEQRVRENMEARRAVAQLEAQIRLMQDDFIGLYKTIQERLRHNVTTVRLVRVPTVESTLTQFRDSQDIQKKFGLVYASQDWNVSQPQRLATNQSAHFERPLYAGRPENKQDTATEKDSLDKERLSKHKRIYSFSQQALIDAEEQQIDLGSTLPDPFRNPPWKVEDATAEKGRKEDAFFATTGHIVLEERKEFLDTFGRNKGFTVSLKPDSLSRLHDLERPLAVAPEEKVGAQLFQDLFPEEARKSRDAHPPGGQPDDHNSFVEYDSKESSVKGGSPEDGKTGVAASSGLLEKVVLLKETGMNRIEAVDFARILLSQSKLIEEERSTRVIESTVGKFESNTIVGTLKG